MFIWSTSPGGVTESVFYGIIGFISLFTLMISWQSASWDHPSHGYREYQKDDPERATPARYAASMAGITFASLLIVMLVIAGLASLAAHPGHNDNIRARQVTALFGLQSDHPYPLVLGDKIQGSSGGAYASSGFFSATASTSLHPATAITVSFTSHNRSYILEIPTVNITFVQSNAVQPTVRMHIAGDDYNNEDNEEAFWVKHYSDCSFAFTNLMPGCHRTIISAKLELTPTTLRRGLAPIVAGNLDSATITLTPTMYRTLVGERN